MTHIGQDRDTKWLTVAIVVAAGFVALAVAGALVHWLTQGDSTPPAPGTYPVEISVGAPEPLPTADVPTPREDTERLHSNTGWEELDTTMNQLYEEYMSRLEQGQ